jgi:WD40 repeat protein
LTYSGHGTSAHAVAFSPDGTKIVSGSSETGYQTDDQAQVWDASSGDLILTYAGHGMVTTIYAVAFSPDGSQIASSGTDGQVHVWDAATGNAILTYSRYAPWSSVRTAPKSLPAAGI